MNKWTSLNQSVFYDRDLNSHWNLTTGHTGSDQTPFLLQQGKDTVWRNNGCVVDSECFEFVFNDFSRIGSESVHADSVHVQRFPHGHFGDQDGVPRNLDGTAGKIVDHAVLESIFFRLEPKIDKLLEELDGTFVIVDSRELDTGGVYNRNVLVVDAIIWILDFFNESIDRWWMEGNVWEIRLIVSKEWWRNESPS